MGAVGGGVRRVRVPRAEGGGRGDLQGPPRAPRRPPAGLERGRRSRRELALEVGIQSAGTEALRLPCWLFNFDCTRVYPVSTNVF